jgi:hypothetical protein
LINLCLLLPTPNIMEKKLPQFAFYLLKIEVEQLTNLEANCGWRIVISSMIPQDSPSCYHSAMCNLIVVLIHLYI